MPIEHEDIVHAAILSSVVAALAAVGWLVAVNVGSDPTTCTVAEVIDGDTFRCDDGRVIRLRGVDAPETMTRWAECSEEIVAGERAASRTTLFLLGQMVTLVDPDPDEDPFGRVIADVRLGYRDVGAWLLREELAVPWPHEDGVWCDG